MHPSAALENRQTLRDIAENLDRLADDQPPLVVYFEKLLACIAETVPLSGAVVWMSQQQNTFAVLVDRNFRTLWPENDLVTERLNQRLLQETIQNRTLQMVPIAVGGHPECDTALFIPVVCRSECVGIIELLGSAQDLADDAAAPRDDWIAIGDAASQFLLELQEAAALSSDDLLEQFQRFSAELHRSLVPSELAACVVGDLPGLLQCDRVSLLVRYGRHWKLIATTGRNRINRRAPQVRQLEQLTRQAMRIDSGVTYAGGYGDLPGPLQEPLSRYLEQSGAAYLAIRRLEIDGSKRNRRRPKCVGALVVERFDESRPTPAVKRLLNPLVRQVAVALANARAHERVCAVPLMRSVGGFLDWFRGRNLAIALVLCGLLSGGIAALMFVEAEYRVEGRGVLMPMTKRRVFSPHDGTVVELLVRDGDEVSAGQPLLLVKNDDLDSRCLEVENLLSQKEKARGALQAELRAASRLHGREHLVRVQAELEENRIDALGLSAQRDHLIRLQEALLVPAPIDGTVAFLVPADETLGRPVFRGDALLEVFDVAGAWQLEVAVPERMAGRLLEAASEDADRRLPVQFQFTAHPENRFDAATKPIAPGSLAVVGPSRQIPLKVEVPDQIDVERRIGADVEARVDCGPESLFEILFGEARDFIKREFWF